MGNLPETILQERHSSERAAWRQTERGRSPLRFGLGRDLRCDLGREHALGRFEVDQRVGVEMGWNDVRPFIQDPMQDLVAIHFEHRDRAAPDAWVDMTANPVRLIIGDPGPELLALSCEVRRSFGSRRRDDEKQRVTLPGSGRAPKA